MSKTFEECCIEICGSWKNGHGCKRCIYMWGESQNGKVPLDEVINLAEKDGDPYDIIEELRKKYGVK